MDMISPPGTPGGSTFHATPPPHFGLRVLGIPESNAKSRIETMVKMVLQLEQPHNNNNNNLDIKIQSSSAENTPSPAAFLSSFSHLLLPRHLVTPEKHSTTTPNSQSSTSSDSDSPHSSSSSSNTFDSAGGGVMDLSVSVVCASDPTRIVKTCASCIKRERKRILKRWEKSGVPTYSSSSFTSSFNNSANTIGSSNNDNKNNSGHHQIDSIFPYETMDPILFNTDALVPLSQNGDALIQFRLICYCRHHKEKTGFCVVFELSQNGKILASASSPPIMITDDHKKAAREAAAAAAAATATAMDASSTSGTLAITSATNSSSSIMQMDEGVDSVSLTTTAPPPPLSSKKKSATTTSSKRRSVMTPCASPSHIEDVSCLPLSSSSSPSLFPFPVMTREHSPPSSSSISFSASSNPTINSSNSIRKRRLHHPSNTSQRNTRSAIPMHDQNIAPPVSLPPTSASEFLFNAAIAAGMNIQQQRLQNQHQQNGLNNRSQFQHFSIPSGDDAMVLPQDPVEAAAFMGTVSSSLSETAGVLERQDKMDLTTPPPFVLQLLTPSVTTTTSHPTPESSSSFKRFRTSDDDFQLQQQLHPQRNHQLQFQQEMPFVDVSPFLGTLSPPLSPPLISKVIPGEGPMHGGVEVTILGRDFYDGISVMFGETLSISTAFWSSNTLVCLLPPSAVPGIVPVSFFNHHLLHNKSSLLTDTKSSSSTTTPPAAYFTYKSPSETCILELALQVINLRLTGVLDDAQQIAMRIVNSSPSTTAPSSNGGGGVGNVESSIVQMLNQLDLKSSQTSSETVMAVAETDILLTTRSASSGHTLAHYACILGMPLLLQNLIDKSRSFGSRNNMLESDYDLNGYTSMHLAVLFGHMDCILCLLKDGMSSSIPDYQGKTALTLAFEMGYEDDVLEAMAISSDDDGGLLTLSIDALTEKYCRKVDDNINSSPPKRVEDDRSSSSVEVPAPSHSQAMATAFAQGLLHQLPQLPQIVLPQLPQFPQMPHFPQLPPFPQLPQFPQFPQIPQMMWNPQAMALYFMSPIAQYGTGNVVVGIPAASSSTTNTPSGTSASTLTSSSHPKLSVDSQSTPTSVHSPASPTSDTSSSSSSSASQPLRQRQQSINKNNGALIQLQQQLQQPPPPRPRWQDANTILDVIILIFNTVRPSRSWSRVCYCGSCAMCRRKEVSSQSSATSSRTGTTITLNQPKSDPYYFSIWFPIVSGLILLGLLHYVLDYYVFEYILRFVNAVDLRSFFATARAGDVAGAGGAAAAIGAPLLFG